MRYVIIGQKDSNELLVVDTQTMTVSAVDASSTALKNADELGLKPVAVFLSMSVRTAS